MKNLKLAAAGIMFAALPAFAGTQTMTTAMAVDESVSESASESISESVSKSVSAPTKACWVTIAKTENGTVSVDKAEGDVGETVTVTAKSDVFYVVKAATVNGTALIESETTTGVYTFALVEGENTLSVTFDIDEELFGDLTAIIREAEQGDWTNLFTLDNVVTIVKWLLDCGILIAIIRYFIKDKKLATQVENKVQEVTEKIVPEATKQAVAENLKESIEPVFEKVTEESALTREVMAILVECIILMQQNTPEAKIAIIDKLEQIKGVTDIESAETVKAYVSQAVAEHDKKYSETISRIEAIEKQLSESSADTEKETETESVDNGTQI